VDQDSEYEDHTGMVAICDKRMEGYKGKKVDKRKEERDEGHDRPTK
jgi:hypothetical protein